MSQCQAPSAPKACQAAHGDCSWSNAAKTGALHSGSHPSSVTRDNVVLRTDEHVGGPQRGAIEGPWLGLQGDDLTEKPWHRTSSSAFHRTWQSARTQGDCARGAPLPRHNSLQGHWKWQSSGLLGPMGTPAACLVKARVSVPARAPRYPKNTSSKRPDVAEAAQTQNRGKIARAGQGSGPESDQRGLRASWSARVA